MKPNPCMWCGRKPIETRAGLWWCHSVKCPQFTAPVDFPTWQKNNPLPQSISMGHPAPHQFKVGDWARVGGKGKMRRIDKIYECAGTNPYTAAVLGGANFPLYELTPATRLKRKEIRERLERLRDIVFDTVEGDAADEFEKLLEDI